MTEWMNKALLKGEEQEGTCGSAAPLTYLQVGTYSLKMKDNRAKGVCVRVSSLWLAQKLQRSCCFAS